MTFVHCDGGVRHAAAVTSTGKCVCWGKHGLKNFSETVDGGATSEVMQINEGLESTIMWAPTDGAKILRVACGWR